MQLEQATSLLLEAGFTVIAPPPPRDPTRITPREGAVLRCLSKGMSNKAICSTLGMRPGTVKAHVASILSKLGVMNRTQAALQATRFL